MSGMKQRLLPLILILMLIFVGCGKSPENKVTGHLNVKEPVTVTLWHYYVGENKQALEAAVAEFNETLGVESGVVVEAVAKASIAELEESVTNSAKGMVNAEPMPDIFSSYADKALEVDRLGMLANINDYLSTEEKARYVPSFFNEGVFGEDRLLVLPIVKSTELLYLNATAWDAFAAVSGYTVKDLSSWEQIGEVARAYYKYTDDVTPDQKWDGKALLGFDSVANFIIIGNKQLGNDVIEALPEGGGRAHLDRAALKRVFDVYYNNMCLGYFDAVGKFRTDDIKTGTLIGYLGSSSGAAYFPTWIEENNAQRDIGFTPIPYPAFSGTPSIAIQQGAGMCIAKSTPAKQEGAALFLKWFTEEKQNISFAMTTGYLPVQTSAYASEGFQKALETLNAGDALQKNIAGVYEITLKRITDSSTYAARAFEGSYGIRSTLQSTLMDIVKADREKAKQLQSEGKSEAEVLAALDQEARFEDWLAAVQSKLKAMEIAYN